MSLNELNDHLKKARAGEEDRRSVYLISLGCDKNTVDAEYMLGDLIRAGFDLTEDPDEADLFIVNTCCFIDAAKEESVDAILSTLPYLNENGARLIVSGCMAERYRKELSEEIPEIDGFIGVKETDRILSLFDDEQDLESEPERVLLEDVPFAYLKISEGCSRNCTYCAIPGIRGRHRSRSPEEILKEAGELENQGVKELILIAQDLTQYGEDRPEYGDFPALLDRIASETNFPWIRLLYLYPEGIDERLVDVIASHSNILPYFDIPIQHTRENILRRMGRKITPQEIESRIELLRDRLDGVVIRTSIITGFPGETDEDHEAMLEDLSRIGFDRLGVFTYSQEENTPAARFPDQIPEEVKEQRATQIMNQQEKIAAKRNKRFVGKTYPVLIETIEDGVAEGRFYADAPEIDGCVLIETDRDLIPGEFYNTKIVQSAGYEFSGELTDASPDGQPL